METITRRGWLLFAAMGAIWGIPYLLIKVAVKHLEPPVVVFGRTSIAAVVLVALAWRADALRPALAHWRYVLLFATMEMAVPWFLLTNAERHLPSGLSGLLVSCVPLVGAVAAFALGDRAALRPIRLVAIGLGMAGVGLLVARDLGGADGIPWLSVGSVLVVCVGYATAPFLATRRLGGVPSIGVIAVSLAFVAIVYAPFAVVTRPTHMPPARALWAVLGLAVICTGIAFVVFFQLISAIGPDRATLITFVNPAVAVVLGAVVLDETITVSTVIGFVLVLSGCWLATRRAPGQLPTRPATADDQSSGPTSWSESSRSAIVDRSASGAGGSRPPAP
ncbi:MAG: protein of unknown function transrane [Ilumatobacteraceae bacterium]|nr:protein of unknown function transrane [Ilumatobacteraceae bacterium]